MVQSRSRRGESAYKPYHTHTCIASGLFAAVYSQVGERDQILNRPLLELLLLTYHYPNPLYEPLAVLRIFY